MGRQIVDWFAALLMLRLMVAVLCILVLQRVLAWVQRTLGAFEPHQLPAPRENAKRHYRKQQYGVRRVRRHQAVRHRVAARFQQHVNQGEGR